MTKTLDRNCQIGDSVQWETVVDDCYEGVLTEWDSNVAVVKLSNGKIKCVEC